MAYNTGNPVGSTDPRDLYDNAPIFDKYVNGDEPFVTDRLGKQRLSISGQNEDFENSQEGREAAFQQFLADSAFIFIGDYAAGLNFTNRSQYMIRDGVPYRLAPSTTVPYVTSGNWILEQPNFSPINSDDVLRQDLAPSGSTVLVGGQLASTIGALAAAVTIGGDGRVRATKFIAGDEILSGAATRDAIVVGRSVTGNTDCHAFADRTIIDAVTDAGTYGVFDATTKLRGSNNQNHLFAFQHRCRYEGTNALQNLAGFLSRPEHAGTGVISKSYGADIGAIAITGGGTVTEQIGVYVRDQIGATANVGINLEQSTGHAYFAAGGGMMHNKGRAGFGISANSNYAASFAGPAAGARRGFIETTAANLQIGAEGDGVTQVISNAGTRLQIKAAANGYSVTPGSDNAQTCGDASNRWSVVWAGTGTISTSDAREKTPVRALTPAEIAAASDLAKEIGAYKFLAAVAEKGGAAREHIGMTVQRAIEIMQSHDLDPYGYGFICHDEWEQQTIEHPEEVVEHPAVYRVSLILDGNSAPIKELVSEAYIEVAKGAWTEVVCDAGDRYSFRESELYAFIAAGFEARLSALESK